VCDHFREKGVKGEIVVIVEGAPARGRRPAEAGHEMAAEVDETADEAEDIADDEAAG
jgi:16S rRNA C1402 (ribose-2'-O) methylase RsmI